jgi:indolepyruvate ferredoxin oxidoreductase beta subunit
MALTNLEKDPYSIIITGVGGQGNVLASRILGSMLVNKGYYVTIGETFGASQRGGSVMSHLRVSGHECWSPQIPVGTADVIASLEPIEAVRVLADYGNPTVRLLTNTRPIYPVNVIKGETTYPVLDELKASVLQLVPGARFIDATEEAVKLGNAIFANIIMLGALHGMNILPLERADFQQAIAERVKKDNVDINMKAFDIGRTLIAE